MAAIVPFVLKAKSAFSTPFFFRALTPMLCPIQFLAFAVRSKYTAQVESWKQHAPHCFPTWRTATNCSVKMHYEICTFRKHLVCSVHADEQQGCLICLTKSSCFVSLRGFSLFLSCCFSSIFLVFI